MERIEQIAIKAGIDEAFVEPYGKYKAKIDTHIMKKLEDRPNGKLVLVTAITPTKAGEGKTTTSIALAEGFGKIGQKAMLVLREPSLGPVFGIKGGATGGGFATIEPSEEINLHFTGDMHALTSSINLISAIIDNHIFQGNELHIDPKRIVWPRAMDMNDRALRNIQVALGEKNGIVREDHFVITVASELMAILCLAKDEQDFIERVQRVIVAYNDKNEPVHIRDLKISQAILKLMREALKPNLVQTQERNPVLVHGGPFANIAHGCNSLIATKMALKLAPIVVTEAGFGADLGAEKFLDIKCRIGELTPQLVIMVATIRALKMHGKQDINALQQLNVQALLEGTCNLKQHVENMKKFGLPVLIAINHFKDDHEEEVQALTEWCKSEGYPVCFLDGYLKGGEGAAPLARKVVDMLEKTSSQYHPLYDLDQTIEEKIECICKEIYHAEQVIYTIEAKEQIALYKKMGYEKLPICMAKTPQSFTDDPKVLGAPQHFTITIREVKLSAGAGFLVALTGAILTMPGLPKLPAAVKMEEESYGKH